MKNTLILSAAILFMVSGLFTNCDKKEAGKEAGVIYTCPMHPDVKKDAPGQCPVCGMDLVKK
jgi:membrane fusion protein, copper/silver efflux system